MSTSKRILITGSTDGIGLETARLLLSRGHEVILHGRSEAKLTKALAELESEAASGLLADLSTLSGAGDLVDQVTALDMPLDALINNAGVLKASEPMTAEGLDIRFVVNTIAPFILTTALVQKMPTIGRIVNVASAAQAPVDLEALQGRRSLADMPAYSQSKLALIQWTNTLTEAPKEGRPVLVSVNPGSLLGTKMVKQGFGIAGKDIQIGAKILADLATTIPAEEADGAYFDNDIGQFGAPHRDAVDPMKAQRVTDVIQSLASAAD